MTHTQITCPNCIVLRAGKKGRPAEVGALAPVFEESVTKLKQKQKKLLKYKPNINSDIERKDFK